MSDPREVRSFNPNQGIAEVQVIQEGAGIIFRTREEIAAYVEAPLLTAVQSLYDRNIRTLSSSANSGDVKYGSGGILIDFDSLSEENRQIAREIGEVQDPDGIFWQQRVVFVHVPTPSGSTVGEIQAQAAQAVSRFIKQEMRWGIQALKTNPLLTPRQELMERFYLKGQVPKKVLGMSNEEVAAELGVCYDPETQHFFLSEEHIRKYKDSLN